MSSKPFISRSGARGSGGQPGDKEAAFGRDAFGRDAFGHEAFGHDGFGRDGFGRDGFDHNVNGAMRRTALRIFLAENHIIIRGGLRALLRARGSFHICGEADNGRDAVELVLKIKPDVVVMNINLPAINGIEATRQIHSALPKTEILIFTAENNEHLVRAALHAGARGYVLKSASDEQVIDAVEALARHQRYVSSAVSEKILNDLTQAEQGNGNGERLTTREGDVLRLIAQGYRSREIALMLGISIKTVDTHRASAMGKLQLRSVAQVVRYAIRQKLIEA